MIPQKKQLKHGIGGILITTEQRLIDANVLAETIRHDFYRVSTPVADQVMYHIENTPTVDAAIVIHGRWDAIPNKYMSVTTKDGSYSGHATSCSVCHEVNPNAFKTNYCPNCGAKMDGKCGTQ